jgi:hypothetical protein
MDARTIRKLNLRQLVAEAGSIDRLAEAAKTSRKTLDQILAGTELPSGAPRGIGHALARRLEAAANKPAGWLDVMHDEQMHPAVTELIEYLRNASMDGRLGVEQVQAIYQVSKAMESH